jgi:hypothetical protein
MVLVLSFHPLDLLDPALMLITLVLCPNDRHPQKVMKHYIYNRPYMSMKWVEGFNHNMQHITSENPSECPTVTTVCEPGQACIISVGLDPYDH